LLDLNNKGLSTKPLKGYFIGQWILEIGGGFKGIKTS
jgi:hypothetical protein